MRLRLATAVAATVSLAGVAFAEPLVVATSEPQPPASVQEPIIQETPFAVALRTVMGAAAAQRQAPDKDDVTALTEFYAVRANRPVWTDEKGLTPSGSAVLAEFGRANDWGLPVGDFALPSLPATGSDGAPPSPAALAAADAQISLSILKYARYARGGRIAEPAKMLSSYLDRKPRLEDPRTVLEEISITGSPDVYLRGLHPQHPQFEKLRREYVKLRDTTATAEARRIPSGPMLRKGMSHQQVAMLRTRLDMPPATGAPAGTDASSYFDDALEAKVKAYQKARHIAADGLVGSGTRNALNSDLPEPGSTRRLLAAMEQWRWMPASLGNVYIWVNIPEYTVRVVKNGEIIHAERVIVGKQQTQTPIFSEGMQTVVVHPNWNVPESIKIKELLPRLESGGGLRGDLRMRRNGREIDPDDIDWSRADIRNYEVYQPSGDDNALGELKFLFPNKHSVYLHDTPSKGLFSESTRTFSHGCMRVRNPVRLAELVLAEDKGWQPSMLKQLMHKGPENNAILLDQKIPVHVTYFTASVDESGSVHYFRDIYGHEKRISLALDGNWSQIDSHPDHLAPTKLSDRSERRGSRSSRRQETALGEGEQAAGFGVGVPPKPIFDAAPAKPANFGPKWGLTKAPRGNTVGDMISRAFGFQN